MTSEDGVMGARRLLRVHQVARRLDMTGRHVLNLIKAGAFQGAFQAQEGGHWKIPRAAVEAFEQRRASAVGRQR